MKTAIEPALSWTPKRRGAIYCSPACGHGCTWAEYQSAKRDAAALAKTLGKGWEPRIWENMHWYYSAILSGTGLKVHPSIAYVLSGRHRLIGYSAYLGYDDSAGGIWVGSGKTPRNAIDAVLGKAEHEINRKAKLVADVILLLQRR